MCVNSSLVWCGCFLAKEDWKIKSRGKKKANFRKLLKTLIEIQSWSSVQQQYFLSESRFGLRDYSLLIMFSTVAMNPRWNIVYLSSCSPKDKLASPCCSKSRVKLSACSFWNFHGEGDRKTRHLWQVCAPHTVRTNQQSALDHSQPTILPWPNCGFHGDSSLIDSFPN